MNRYSRPDYHQLNVKYMNHCKRLNDDTTILKRIIPDLHGIIVQWEITIALYNLDYIVDVIDFDIIHLN